MNYHILFHRGYKYFTDAGQNWYNRRQKLTTAWVNKYGSNTVARERINVILYDIDTRIKWITAYKTAANEKRRRDEWDVVNQYISLECRNKNCNHPFDYTGISVRQYNYVASEIKCPYCGKPMLSNEDIELDYILRSLGISTID